ncbi:uncharacterized protein BDZ99DRAFT_452651 [Mytilinidion resinicola]|uniref:Uncharacterized protein n=1 Tax=Mytilinidion resinicola TaxID=574789 RepID=A0A6A6Y5M1_9PEZI|nr:uncharacterized protein BDZ99DRAFT_452651 [Mytilinidion resinicola]KAF2804106.1 hypothetical protein BDZ99DRAFT_452651 [Mytilinidion resinicola]
MAPPGAGASKKGQKQVFKLDSPFTETTMPPIADNDKDIILDMLCNLLTPIGRHRTAHILPSKGRSNRNLKRKRAAQVPPSPPSQQPPPPPPPAPTLSAHLTIGLNATTRHLEALAAQPTPSPTPPATSPEAGKPAPTRALALVLIPHPNPARSLIHAHIPTLVALASVQGDQLAKGTTERQPTRLVALPSSSEARLASALHLPRLSALGILEGAPGADALVEFVREKVGCVEVGWLGEAGLEGNGENGGWRGITGRVG